MPLPHSNWSFYAQVLARALNALESACTAAPDSSEFNFYRAEAPAILEEAREALAAMQHLLHDAAPKPPPLPPRGTRH